MRHASLFLLLLIATLTGCGSQPAASPPATQSQSTGTGGSEILVRAAIAKVTKTEAASIPMDRPIGDPPLKADELTLVEIILELENRAGIDISEETIDRHGGKTRDGPVKVTPNQIVKMVEDSPKSGGSNR